MRRKLINWEAFERIQKDSLSAAEHELLEASDVLSRALGVDQLELDCYSDSNVIYETLDGTFVRADYSLAHDHLTFENIEELVVDEETAAQANKKKIAEMVDAILGNQNEKASQQLAEYMSSPVVRKSLLEGRNAGFIRPKDEVKKAAKSKSKNASKFRIKNQKKKLDAFGAPSTEPRVARGTHKGPKEDPNYFKKDWSRRKHKPRNVINAKGGVERKKFMKECHVLAENVLEFVTFQELGPVLKESVVKKDHIGNVIAVRIPTLHHRNESRILTINHKHHLDSDVKVVREEAHKLSHDPMFCKAVAELKRHNNLSDSEGLQESLSTIIGQWPSVLYLSQNELSQTIGEALSMVGISNYDDRTCTFMAEGILRTAHEVFGDKVERILQLASANVKVEGDHYIHFQNVVHQFYPTLDENVKTQMKVFSDLYHAVNEVWELAHNAGDAAVIQDAENILDELHAVVNGQSDGDLNLAQQIAEWLSHFVESNLEGSEWQVSNTPFQTINGDHPAMAEKARKSYAPAADFGPDAEAWHNRATEKQFTGPQWTSVGGGEVFPGLNNPYIPKPFGDYTMNGEKGVDKDFNNGEGMWQSNDTWPNLQNPYVPKAETPKSYQMKNGSETDLIVNK